MYNIITHFVFNNHLVSSTMSIKLRKHIFDSFEEICRLDTIKLLTQVAEHYGSKYGFTAEDLIEEYLPDNKVIVNIVSDSVVDNITENKCQKQLRKIKRANAEKKRQELEKYNKNKTRCIARIWGDGKGPQCSRYSLKDKDYCGTHQNQLIKKGFIWQGTIYDEINKVVKLCQDNKRKKHA